MFSLPDLITAGLCGLLIGCIFFYCLWFSTNKMLHSHHPVAWFVGAWLARMLFALSGFYLVSRGNWPPLIACLVGFIAGRWLVRKRIVDKAVNAQVHLAPTNSKVLAAKSPSGAKHAP